MIASKYEKVLIQIRGYQMSSWLKCSIVEPGMLPGEYAVETETLGGKKVSLFAPAEKVKQGERLIRVDVVDEKEASTLVRLPAPAFEVSSQMISVPKGNVMQC